MTAESTVLLNLSNNNKAKADENRINAALQEISSMLLNEDFDPVTWEVYDIALQNHECIIFALRAKSESNQVAASCSYAIVDFFNKDELPASDAKLKITPAHTAKLGEVQQILDVHMLEITGTFREAIAYEALEAWRNDDADTDDTFPE